MSFLAGMNQAVLVTLALLGLVYLFCGLDDLFIDLVAWIGRLGPTKLSPAEMAAMDALPEKKIAVIVPAWKESRIIRRMLVGNCSWLDYQSYHFFVGVYPNDEATVKEVQEVAARYPNVHAVVNSRPGPSSKGQILNHVVRQIFAMEGKLGFAFDAFLMQDAEDLMHPKVFRLVNRELDTHDFVQIPVFSLGVDPKALVAGTYVDEFAESHTKDLLVREKLGAAIPSAGVGTALSSELVLAMITANEGDLFEEGALTEDYQLGIRAKALGFTPRFACCHYRDPQTGRREYIATREYFPRHFTRSIRQKTRWTIGIALQGWRNLGWPGGLANRYFLFRDRRGLVANVLALAGYGCSGWVAAYASIANAAPARGLVSKPVVAGLLAANVFLMANRIFQRVRCVWLVYGPLATLPVPLRWPLATCINAVAGLQAVRADSIARWTQAALAWVKTEHELPSSFGEESRTPEIAR